MSLGTRSMRKPSRVYRDYALLVPKLDRSQASHEFPGYAWINVFDVDLVRKLCETKDLQS